MLGRSRSLMMVHAQLTARLKRTTSPTDLLHLLHENSELVGAVQTVAACGALARSIADSKRKGDRFSVDCPEELTSLIGNLVSKFTESGEITSCPRLVANTAWALAQMDGGQRAGGGGSSIQARFISSSIKSLPVTVGDMNPQEISLLLWSMARCCQRRNRSKFADGLHPTQIAEVTGLAIENGILHLDTASDPQHTSTIFWALGTIFPSIPGHAITCKTDMLVNVVRRLLVDFDTMLELANSVAIGNIAEGLLKLQRVEAALKEIYLSSAFGRRVLQVLSDMSPSQVCVILATVEAQRRCDSVDEVWEEIWQAAVERIELQAANFSPGEVSIVLKAISNLTLATTEIDRLINALAPEALRKAKDSPSCAVTLLSAVATHKNNPACTGELINSTLDLLRTYPAHSLSGAQRKSLTVACRGLNIPVTEILDFSVT